VLADHLTQNNAPSDSESAAAAAETFFYALHLDFWLLIDAMCFSDWTVL